MHSSENLERFYFQYQSEALPHGEFLQSFCVKNKVPYNIFQKWFKKIKWELLSRETYSRNPINYSEGMADDQKDQFIQYLAEQHQEDELTKRAIELVLEDFMTEMKELKNQMASMQSKQSDLENQVSEERKLRKSAERKAKSLREKLDFADQERFGDRRQRINSKAKKSDSDRQKEKDDYDVDDTLRMNSVGVKKLKK